MSADQIRNGNGLTSTVEYALLDASQELFHPLSCGSKSACLISELDSDLACPKQLPVDGAATEYTSTDPDAPLDASQNIQCGPVDIEYIPASDASAAYSACVMPAPKPFTVDCVTLPQGIKSRREKTEKSDNPVYR
jgi:hypothetical protein